MKNKSVFWYVIALGMVLLSCGGQNQTLKEQIENEESAWAGLRISRYRMKIVESSIWYQVELSIIVKDGAVESAQPTCGRAPMDDNETINCKNKISNLDVKEYTVEGLFKRLQTSEQDFERNYGNTPGVAWYDCFLITFDEQYHFPAKISFNHPEAMDEEYTITVSDFEVIE